MTVFQNRYRAAYWAATAAMLCGLVACLTHRSGSCLSAPSEVVVRGDDSGRTNWSVEFEVRNTGGTALTLLGSKSSCGCTVPSEPSKSRLQAGESCVIPLSVSTPLMGEDFVQVELYTDSRQTPIVWVPIRLVAGQPKTPVLIDLPRSLVLGEPEPNGIERTFVLTTLERLSSPNWITSLTSDRPEMSVKIIKTTDSPVDGQPMLVHRQYFLQAQLREVLQASQSLVCRVGFVASAEFPQPDFVSDVRLIGNRQ